jgi:hypothetical protein
MIRISTITARIPEDSDSSSASSIVIRHYLNSASGDKNALLLINPAKR